MELFGGQQRKAVAQVVTGLRAKNGTGARASTVGTDFALREDLADEVEVGSHEGLGLRLIIMAAMPQFAFHLQKQDGRQEKPDGRLPRI